MTSKPGATLLFALWIPGASEDAEADMVADEFRDIINEERERNGGPAEKVEVSIPLPTWVTPGMMDQYRRFREWLATQEDPDE